MPNKKPTILSTGRTSIQGQIPFIPFVISLPSINDPQSQNGSQVILSSGVAANDGIYSFDGRTQPGIWTKVASIGTSFGIQTANFVYAGPTSGAAALPTFRLLTTPDIPIVKEANINAISVNANTTSQQDLNFVDFSPTELNRAGRVVELVCFGTFDELSGPTITYRVLLGATTILTFVPNTPSATATNLPWTLKAWLIVATIGATGTLEVHGEFTSDPSTSNGRVSTNQLDLITAVTGAVDLTSALRLKLTIAFSSGSTSNVGRQRLMVSKIYN